MGGCAKPVLTGPTVGSITPLLIVPVIRGGAGPGNRSGPFSRGTPTMASFGGSPFARSPFSRSPFDNGLFGSIGGRAAPPEYRQPYSPEDATSMQQNLLHAGTSGLQYVLGTLDKPGRAVRGLLGGRPEESLALVPFSDTLGLTNPENTVTGRDLLDQAGITTRGDEGWGPWLGGIAAEIATDPLTYATFGAKSAVTPAGALLKKIGATKGFTGKHYLEGFHALEPELKAAGMTADELAHYARGGAVERLPAFNASLKGGRRIASQEAMDALAKKGLSIRPGEALSGQVGFGLPWQTPAKVFGQGPMAQGLADITGKALDAVKYSPFVRPMNALFNKSVGRAVDAITQRGNVLHTTPALQSLEAAARGEHYLRRQLFGELERAIPGAAPIDVLKEYRQAVEGGFPLSPAIAAHIDRLTELTQQQLRAQMAAAKAQGLPIDDLQDLYALYATRHALEHGAANTQVLGGKLYDISHGSAQRRKPWLRDQPGLTQAIDRWAVDPDLSGPLRNLKPKAAAAKIHDQMVADWQRLTQDRLSLPFPPQVPQDVSDALLIKADKVQEALRNLSPKHAAEGLPLFTPDFLKDLELRGRAHARTMAGARGAIGTITDVAQPFEKGMVRLSDVLNRVGLRSTRFNPMTGEPAQGALVEALKGLAQHGAPEVGGFLQGETLKELRKQVNAFGLPPEVADQVIKNYNRWITPEELKAPLGFFDSATNMFKGLTYPVWIPSHVRNLISAGMSNLTDLTAPRDYRLAYRIMRDTATTPEIAAHFADLPAGLTDQAAREWVRGKAYEFGKVFGGHNQVTDLAGQLPALVSEGGQITAPLPGVNRAGPTGNLAGDIANLILKEGIGGTARNVAAIRGVRDIPRAFEMQGVGGLTRKATDQSNEFLRRVDAGRPLETVGRDVARKDFPALAAGRVGGTNIEDFVRLSNMLGNIRQGMSWEQAAQRMQQLHFDYDALTPFEKQWMKRMVPFYTFQRKNLPLQLSRIGVRPGSITAQLRPIGTDPNQYIPQYLASGVAVPTGPESPEGNQQYLSQVGLPVEEAFERLKFKNNLPDLGGTALAYMSGMNPLVKLLPEELSGVQWHTGRKLSDLRPPAVASLGGYLDPEQAQIPAHILLNTPLSRFVTAVDKLIDPRKSALAKATNLLTGARVTDVDVNKAKAIEARNALEKVLGRLPNVDEFTDYYVRPENAANLTPDQIKYLRAWATYRQQSKAYGEQQRRAAAMAAAR